MQEPFGVRQHEVAWRKAGGSQNTRHGDVGGADEDKASALGFRAWRSSSSMRVGSTMSCGPYFDASIWIFFAASSFGAGMVIFSTPSL